MPSQALTVLLVVVGVLSAVAALTGLLWTGGSAPSSVVSVRGEQVELYGQGLYRYDSVFRAAGNRGTDLVTLVVGLPLLVWSARRNRRGDLAGALLLAGALTWFLYVSASVALGSAYNELFLVQVALVAASAWALALTVRSADPLEPTPAQQEALPRRGLVALLVGAGLVAAVVWLLPILAALPSGAPPLLLHSTTMVTEVLDLALIAPTSVVAGLLLHRGTRAGLVLGVPLLVLLVVLAPAIIAQTVAQLDAGWQLGVAEVVGPLGGFLVLGGLAAWLLGGTLRALARTGRPVAREAGIRSR